MAEEKNIGEVKKKFRRIEYDEVKASIQDGDVLMYGGRTLIAWLIRGITWSRYSHAGIAVHWNERHMAMESIWPMVILDPLSHSLNRYKGRVDLYSCNEENPVDKQLDPDKRLKMVIFAQRQLGRRYSLWKLISFLFLFLFKRTTTEEDRLKRYDTEFTCSEYVARIYNYIGLDLMKYKADRFTTPRNIADSPLLRYRGTLETKKRPKPVPEALEDANKAIELDPEFSYANFGRGMALASLNKPQDAIKDFDKAIELAPTFSRSFLNRGYTFLKLGKTEQALEDLKKAASLGNNAAQTYLKKKGI